MLYTILYIILYLYIHIDYIYIHIHCVYIYTYSLCIYIYTRIEGPCLSINKIIGNIIEEHERTWGHKGIHN